MATNYPTSADDNTTLPNPLTTSKRNSPSLAGGQSNQNDAIKAIEAKVGTGASTPVVSTLLFGTGTGTSAWTQLTSAQLAASMSDETGSGSIVFATTPTLVTPKIDTINESTPGNGTTVGGVNIKSGALTTTNSVVTANLTNASVTASKLATGAQMATVVTSETTTSTSFTDLATTSDTVTVTIGANGLALVILTSELTNSGANSTRVSFAASGANTIAASDARALINQSTNDEAKSWSYLATGLSTGSTVFKMKYRVTGGTGTFLARYITVIPL